MATKFDSIKQNPENNMHALNESMAQLKEGNVAEDIAVVIISCRGHYDD